MHFYPTEHRTKGYNSGMIKKVLKVHLYPTGHHAQGYNSGIINIGAIEMSTGSP